jgi:phospholipid transport system substrate-binding protein
MLRIFAFALALATSVVASHPAAAQAPAPAAAVQTPDQVVQTIADDLGKSIDGHQAEL